jgi:glycosyltransferase involved in cell wall biosynthesis
MKVLLLTQVLPYPPDSGPKVKTWNVLKYLAQHHDLTLVSFVRGDQSAEVKHLQSYCHAVHTVPMERGIVPDGLAMLRSMLTGQPWMMLRDDRPTMRQLVDQLAAKTQFDIAHADQLNMAQYAARVSGARKVLDAHNALWLLYQRLWQTMPSSPKKWLLGRDWRLLKSYEGQICRDFDAVLAVSEEDKTALQEAIQIKGKSGRMKDDHIELDASFHPSSPAPDRGFILHPSITVIPIAVDTDEVASVARHPDADHILHIGTMYWPPNIDGILWFIREIYPHIRAKRPGAIFDVVGARPPQDIINLSGPDSGINVTGYVPDPTPYRQQAGVMVVPLRAGGGMRVKILEALAQGLPIVSTTLGCEGIAVTHGQNILIADTPSDFTAAVLSLLDNPEMATQLGRQGRQLAEQVYDYRQVCRPLEAVYQQTETA